MIYFTCVEKLPQSLLKFGGDVLQRQMVNNLSFSLFPDSMSLVLFLNLFAVLPHLALSQLLADGVIVRRSVGVEAAGKVKVVIRERELAPDKFCFSPNQFNIVVYKKILPLVFVRTVFSGSALCLADESPSGDKHLRQVAVLKVRRGEADRHDQPGHDLGRAA
jgi:hypothetical protein